MHWPPHRILHSIRSSQSDPFPLSPANRPDSVHPTNSLLRASPSPRFRSGSPSSSVPRSRSGYCSHSVHSGHCDALHAPNRYETHLKSRHEPRGIDRRKSAARALSVESEGHKIWTNAIGGVESALFIARSAISGEIISKNTSAIKWTTDGQWAATNDAANGQNAHHFVSASLPKHCNQCRGGMARVGSSEKSSKKIPRWRSHHRKIRKLIVTIFEEDGHRERERESVFPSNPRPMHSDTAMLSHSPNTLSNCCSNWCRRRSSKWRLIESATNILPMGLPPSFPSFGHDGDPRPIMVSRR